MKSGQPIRRAAAALLATASLLPGTAAFAAEQEQRAAAEPAAAEADATNDQPGSAIIVQGQRFYYEEAGSALKIPLSIKDTPQTVVAITEDMLEFANVSALQDIYKLDASASATHATADTTVNYYRGFRQQSSNGVRIDGFRLNIDTPLDFAPFERIELVKGATSTLYGQNSIAGTMNVISKAPRADFGGELMFEAGSFRHYRGEVDLYGPLTSDGRLTFRLVGAYTDEGSHLRYVHQRIGVIAPMLRFEFTPDTSVTTRINYQHYDTVPFFGPGLIYDGDALDGLINGFDPDKLKRPDLPRNFFNGTDADKSLMKNFTWQTTFEHRFANDWQLRANAQYVAGSARWESIFSGFAGADYVPIYNRQSKNRTSNKLYGGEVNIFGDVHFLGGKHTLFFGADYSRIRFPILAAHAEIERLSMRDPNYVTGVPRRPDMKDFDTFYQRLLFQEDFGLTAQAMLRPLKGLTLTLGARYSRDRISDSVRTDTIDLIDDHVAAPFRKSSLTTGKMTFQAGATYALTPGTNLYASYGQTYEPKTERQSIDKYIDPEEGRAYELGLKGNLARKLSYSIALYYMTRSNIAQSRFDTDFFDPIGTQRSQGVEFSLQGTVIDGWEAYVSVSALDAAFIDGTFKGLRPEGAPKLGVSAFTSYEFRDGPLKGFGFGAGVVHKSAYRTFFSETDAAGRPLPYRMPANTEVDLRAFYAAGDWNMSVSVTNLFNTRYHALSHNGFAFGFNVNPGRAAIVRVARSF